MAHVHMTANDSANTTNMLLLQRIPVNVPSTTVYLEDAQLPWMKDSNLALSFSPEEEQAHTKHRDIKWLQNKLGHIYTDFCCTLPLAAMQCTS